MKLESTILSAALSIGTAWAEGQSPADPISNLKAFTLLEGMPSFYQRNSEFDGGGKNFCGPTAASNALMWLADNGYPNLKPAAENGYRAQTEMIKQLAGFMGTYRQGTPVSAFTCGVKTYLKTAGYSSKSWVYSGNSSANRTQDPPDINLLKAVSAGNTAIWFSVGWYSLDESNQKYTRECGHWLTLVGFGKNRDGEDDSNRLVIADSESPNSHKYITLRMLNDGKLSNGRSRMDAKGYFHVAELDKRRGDGRDEYCILETIEALTIE
jgi:hypothetical protein